MDESALLAAALRYADNGIAIFPARLYVRGNGKKGVQPISDWDAASTCDPEIIRSWFTGIWQDAALCIDCGKSGIVGIDQDVSEGKNGRAAWSELDPPATWRVRSPTGGAHDYYRADPDHPFTVDNTGAVADGVDVRGMGGFLFAPPSVDPRGGAWQWMEGEPEWAQLPMVPEIVIKRMEQAAARKRAKSIAPPALNAPLPADSGSQLFGQGSTYGPGAGLKKQSAARALLSSRLEEFLSRTEEGNARSHFLAQDLGVLAGHGVGVFWSYADALETLCEAARDNGMTAVHGAAYVADQARRGLEYGMRELWVPAPEDAPAGVAPLAAEKGRLHRALMTRSQVHELADPVPLIEDVLYRESIVVLSGKFGTYKSFVAVSWAASLATGREWFGHRVPAPVPVIYAAAEGAYGIRKRLDAWEQKYATVIPDDLHLISVSVRINRPGDVEELEEIIRETGAQVLIFDTLHMSTPGVDENDSGEMGMVMDVLRVLQQRHGITSILPHHTGHAGERARGSSSVEDDADTTFVLRLEGEDRGPASVRTLVHRKTKDAALLEPVTLKLELMKGTGSGVVRPYNAFEDAEGRNETDADIGQADVIQEPQPWTHVAQTHPAAMTQWRILQTLADVARTVGRTESQVCKLLASRWHEGKTGRGEGALNVQSFGKAWVKVLELESGGERIVTSGSNGPKSMILNRAWCEANGVSDSD